MTDRFTKEYTLRPREQAGFGVCGLAVEPVEDVPAAPVPQKMVKLRRKATGARTKTSKWPSLDSGAVAAALSQAKTLDDLMSASPVKLRPEERHTERLLQQLFPSRSLLCVGASASRFDTRPLEAWRGAVSEDQFIVANPMSSLFGRRKKDGRKSKHTLSNTGPRRFLVVEFDKDADRDTQAAKLLHLAQVAPLTLVVDSGGKSLHGWFYCHDVPESDVKRFFWHAVKLGADWHLWVRCYFVRLPDGTRENGERQFVRYFAPATLTGQAAEKWKIPAEWVVNEETAVEELKEDESVCDTHASHAPQATQATHAVNIRTIERGQLSTPESIVKFCIPSQVHATNDALWNLARGARTLEALQGLEPHTMPHEDLTKLLFNPWHEQTPKELLSKPRGEYLMEFLDANERAEARLDTTSLADCYQRVINNPLPPLPQSVLDFDTPDLTILAALCRELQIAAGEGKNFFLTGRDAAALLGHNTHATVARWLRVLSAPGAKVLRKVKDGSYAEGLGFGSTRGH